MEIKAYQQLVDQWIQKYGVRYFDEKTNMLLLMEEVGELSRLIARIYGEQSFKQGMTADKSSIEDEMADIFFVLTCLCNQMDIDITNIINKNIQKKTQRDSERHQKNDKLNR
ncbi:nucleotide pyrophosphohydrolase [Membranihabitans marinus]|uniref:nucleotide pyrophosphohydrolase n=1 Tax=Membranihabitans marinus TaxID=1227546 RepID=UPI001F44B5BE|nr:nucleotide pyrophosphohydrolase [Membranihabitans marinus]